MTGYGAESFISWLLFWNYVPRTFFRGMSKLMGKIQHCIVYLPGVRIASLTMRSTLMNYGSKYKQKTSITTIMTIDNDKWA